MNIDEFLADADNELQSALRPLSDLGGLTAILGPPNRTPGGYAKPEPAVAEVSLDIRIHDIIGKLVYVQERFLYDDPEYHRIDRCCDNLLELSRGLEQQILSHAEADAVLRDARDTLRDLAASERRAAAWRIRPLIDDLEVVARAVRRLFDFDEAHTTKP